MKKEDLKPIERLAFNCANDVLKKNIEIEDINYVSIDWDSVVFHPNGLVPDIEVSLAILGIKYAEIDEKQKEMFADSIDYVVQLARDGLGVREAVIPNLSDLLKLKLVSDKWLNLFRRRLENFYEELTGERLHIITVGLGDKDIGFTDDEKGEYVLPLEVLSLPASEAKVKYGELLKEQSQLHKDQEVKGLMDDIKLYKGLIERAEKKLKELEKN